MFKKSRGRIAGCFLVLAVALAAAAPVANAADINKTPKKHYVALGDSLAFGFQSYKVAGCAGTGCTSPNTQFSTGYVDAFTTHLKTIKPDINTINLGCPGATSSTLNNTVGCTTYPFPTHDAYGAGQSQLDTAIAFLNSKEGKQTSPITLNIGNNDVLAQVAACGGPTSPTLLPCLGAAAPALYAQIGANVTSTLGQLRAAAPDAKIILFGVYNPFEALPIPGLGAGGNALSAALNGVLASAGATVDADFANPLPAFNLTGPQPATICSLTLMCPPSPGAPDIHASDAGYQKLADLAWDASGYASID